MTRWYQELFSNYAEAYDKEPFTQGTTGEVDFIETELGCDKTKSVLDIGCGTGRHAIELARRGYRVTGLDLSAAQLAKAREKADRAKVSVEFLQKDARDFDFQHSYDMAIMICEGAFPLMETDEMNYRILQNAAISLKAGGKLILTTLNALYPLTRFGQKPAASDSVEAPPLDAGNFDLLTLRDVSDVTITDDSGEEKTLSCDERYYMPSEISWYLKSLGFREVAIHGCRLGAFSRQDKLGADDFEMLVIAMK